MLAVLADHFSFSGNAGQLFPLSPALIKTEVLSGLTVALAMVPEAVAFSFVAGVHPLVGLYAAFIVGLVTALIGGRPGMVSGATGALAVVMVALVSAHGVEYLFATVVLMGIMQVLAGVLHLGKFIRLVPHPVMMGFVNGLAIIIFLAQMTQFQIPDADGVQCLDERRAAGDDAGTGRPDHGDHLAGAEADDDRALPAPLAAIAIVAGIVIAFDINVPTRRRSGIHRRGPAATASCRWCR